MRQILCRVTAALFVAAFVVAAGASGATFKAGVARADITPPPGEQLWGYESRKQPATGTLDPLYARVLVLETDQTRVALVTLDLGRSFGRDSIMRIREEAKTSSGIDYVLVVAAHTHSAPVVEDHYPNGPPAWEAAAIEKIGKAIAQAQASAVEAKIGTGYGVSYIGHNRLRHNPDGSVSWFETNTTKIPTAPVDPTVAVLRIDTAEGKPLAVLVNYACHPVIFGPDNLEYSADWVGVMIKTVEAQVGESVEGFFLQGAPGDINPYYAVTPLAQDAIHWRDWTGQHLGEEAARVAERIHTHAVEAPSIQYAEDLLTFHLRWDANKFRQALAGHGFLIESGQVQPEFQLPVSTVLLNNQIAFMGMPGEPFVNFQKNWRDRCPVRDCFFLGYANGYFGYFPTIVASTESGYGAASSSTWIEPGAGERMVNHAVVEVYKMLGRYGDLPEDLK